MPSLPPEPALVSRRRLLGLAGAGTLAALLPACGTDGAVRDSPFARAYCVPRSTLDAHRELDGLPLVYEVDERRSSFSFEAGFYSSLAGWLQSYRRATGTPQPDQVWSYGAWTDGGSACDSWHNAGRAFDLARLRLEGGGFVSCRYDQWQQSTGAARERALRQYWALAASLHLDFAYVLTYLYNAAHHNHIHIDNGRSGGQPSTLSTRSQVQLQAVQAICRYLWNEPVEITGRWDQATRRASRSVLDRAEVGDALDESVESWRSFLTASVARGVD